MAERPFYEEARDNYVPKPPTTAALIVTLGIAFLCGIGMFAASARGALGLSGAEAVGYTIGGSFMGALLVSAILAAILYFFVGLRSKDRGGGRDFAMLFGSTMGGSVVALAAAMALAGPAMGDQKAAEAVMDHQRAVLAADGQAFDAEIDALIGPQSFLSPARLSRDAGYRQSRKMLAEGREVMGVYRALFEQRKAEGRKALSAAVKSKRRREEFLAAYDAEIARTASLNTRYWALQAETIDSVEAMLTHLSRSPGGWQGDRYMFRRQGDLDRFRALGRKAEEKSRAIEAVMAEMEAYRRQAALARRQAGRR